MDADKIQEFIIHHIEKIILLVVVVVSGLLVYKGLQQENILESHHPDRLSADAQQVRAEVDEDHNAVILPDRIPDFDINKEIDRRRRPVEPAPYAVVTWEPMEINASIRRDDPVLIAPQALQVHGVLASMALRSSDGMYALKDLDAAEPIDAEAQPVRKPKTSRRRGRGSTEQDMEAMMSMFEGMEEMEMMGPGPEESMASNTATRRLKDPLGMRPTDTRHIINNRLQPPVPGIGWFIAGTAVLPYKALHESYKKAFAQAGGYNPSQRDQPIFTGYELQRADVTDKPVDQLNEADWVKRDGRTECIKDAVLLWSGFAPEIVPADYRVDKTLTMWIPPVMLTDYSYFSLHPLIPMLSRQALDLEAAAKEAEQDVPVEVKAEDIVIGDAGVPTSFSFDESGAMPDRPFQSERMEIEIDPVDFKLIRFYDFAIDPKDPNAPKPERKYVYRVRISVEDPNFPVNPLLQPKGSNLASDAYVRVMKLVSRVENAENPVEQRKIDSRRWSDWSEPSKPVSLPGRDHAYIGPVAERKSRPVKVGERLIPYEYEPPKAEVVVSQFNTQYSTRLSMLLKDISEGSVLSRKKEFADIVDPITLAIKKAPNARIESDVTVIDIDGGQTLAIQGEGEEMVSPSMMLMFDANGGLKVHDEVDDLEFFRVESFADRRGK